MSLSQECKSELIFSKSHKPVCFESSSLRSVVALCVHEKGHYSSLLGGENCWNIHRDARTFNGDQSVVAHPPCGPWGRLSHMCTKQDADVAHFCVDHVRRCGGVLEHPAYSKLWEYHAMPRPGFFPDEYGGITVPTTLAAFGADVMKRTWVYVCGSDQYIQPPYRQTVPTRLVKNLSSWQRQITPLLMCQWLIDIASATKSQGDR